MNKIGKEEFLNKFIDDNMPNVETVGTIYEKMINSKGQTEEEFLRDYKPEDYEKPSVTVDTLIFTIDDKDTKNYRKLPEKELKLLMIKRGNHPYMGNWAIPGGFVDINESMEQAAERELFEETGVKDVYLEQLYTFGDVERDPRMRVVSTSYMALADKATLNVKAGDDADEAKWFSVKSKVLKEIKTDIKNGYIFERFIQLVLINGEISASARLIERKIYKNKKSTIEYEIVDSNGIAFDHAKIIYMAITRLRNKVEYTDIVFNLMPTLFTLTELQKVYSILLDKELFATQFRRKVLPMVVETNKTTKGGGQRPAKLYMFNPHWND